MAKGLRTSVRSQNTGDLALGRTDGWSRPLPGIALAAALVTLLMCGLWLASAARGASVDQAVAYQLDAAHDGYQTGSPITTPLSQAWSDTLSGAISYPLIVNGVVYVTAASGSGTNLYALAQATGSTLWSHALGGTAPWSGLAYDAGRIFTVNSNGTLTAFDATTGAVVWSASLPGQTSFSSPPTALNGYVYTGGSGSGGTLYAISEATGRIAWTEPVENGDNSSPAVDAGGVYVAYACGQDYDFDPQTGASVWHHTGPCEGGGGKTPVLANGEVLARDPVSGNLVLSAAVGNTEGAFSATPAPAVDNGDAYTVGGGALTAVGSSGLGNIDWTFNGDGQLDTAPLVVGSLVFEGSSGGNLYAIDAASGALQWSTLLGSAIPSPDEQNLSQPLTGLAAGEGTLVVPDGTTLKTFAGANVGSGTPTNSLAPGVAGTHVVGQPVGADVGVWSGLPTAYAYQWKACPPGGSCADITGATGESYTPTSAEAGDTLEVSVSATNASGTSSAVISPASAAVSSIPVNTSAPTISGVPAYGQLLTASPGTWSGSLSGYSYQWLRCSGGTCTPVSGATSSTYIVAAADVGSQIEVRVAATNADGAATATSQPTLTVPTVATTVNLSASANPVLVGKPLTLTATISPNVDGGTVSFSQDGQPMSWCQNLPVGGSSSTATCGGTTVNAGEDAISVTYSGDGTFNASSASLTEDIVTTLPPSNSSPPGVVMTSTPPSGSSNVTLYYRETGGVDSTVCTIDQRQVACDGSHAVLSGLKAGKHTFLVEVFGASGSAHASVTWTVLASAAKLPAPKHVHLKRTAWGLALTWARVRGARAYRVTVTVKRHATSYRVRSSARSFRVKLGSHERASIRLCALAAGGRPGNAAVGSV